MACNLNSFLFILCSEGSSLSNLYFPFPFRCIGQCEWSFSWECDEDCPLRNYLKNFLPILKRHSYFFLLSADYFSSGFFIFKRLWSCSIFCSHFSQKLKKTHSRHLYLIPVIGSDPQPLHLTPSCLVTSSMWSTLETMVYWFSWFFMQGIKDLILSSIIRATFWLINPSTI